MSLYNDMRPQTLDEIMGQDKIVKVLKKDLTGGKIPNAMLFTGTRGVGKTSIARIVARTINCSSLTAEHNCCNACDSCRQILGGTSFDVLELDAASHNSVEDIRELLGMVQYKAIGKYKVFIIDEVHMLSTAAFNCLLKTLEEPPANVVFILCTTEAHKVPATILSRCRKYEFERISRATIVNKLKKINSIYGLDVEENALHVVAKMAKGSMRDAESIYEHFLETTETVTAEMVRDLLGVTSEESVFSILQGVVEKNPSIATMVIKETSDKGASLAFLIEECFRILMDVVSFKMSGDESEIVDSDEYRQNIIKFSYELSDELCFAIMDALREAYSQKNANLEFAFEAAIISVLQRESVIQQLLERVSVLEEKVQNFSVNNITAVNSVSLPVTECPAPNVESEPVEEDSSPAEDYSHLDDDFPMEYYSRMADNLPSEDYSQEVDSYPVESAVVATETTVVAEKSEPASVSETPSDFQPATGTPFDSDDSISFDELMASLEDTPDDFSENASVTATDKSKPKEEPTEMQSSFDFDAFLSGSDDCARQGGFGFGWGQDT